MTLQMDGRSDGWIGGNNNIPAFSSQKRGDKNKKKKQSEYHMLQLRLMLIRVFTGSFVILFE